MADLEQILKALRLVPEFDGNPNVLTRFVKLCDELVAGLLSADASSLCTIALLNGILNKITGPAARLINSNGVPDSWNGIRTALINNFSDQRDESSLYNDLALLTQGSGTPQEYYEKCQNLFSTIMTYISLHETVSTTIESKRQLYKTLTLKAYLRGLKDPLGSRIRCMRPESIEKALELVHEETNTMYMQQRNNIFSERKVNSEAMQPQPRNNFNTLPFTPPKFFMPQTTNPYRVPTQPWKPHPQQGPSRTQMMFRAPPPGYNQSTNVFRLPPRNSVPVHNYSQKPQPMSGVSHYVARPAPLRGHDWSKSGNPPPNPYFRSREMNFNECNDQYFPYDDCYSEYYSDYYYPQEYHEYEVNDNDCYDLPQSSREYNLLDRDERAEIKEENTTNEDKNFHKQAILDKPK